MIDGRRALRLAAALVVFVALAACGSQASIEEIEVAAGGSVRAPGEGPSDSVAGSVEHVEGADPADTGRTDAEADSGEATDQSAVAGEAVGPEPVPGQDPAAQDTAGEDLAAAGADEGSGEVVRIGTIGHLSGPIGASTRHAAIAVQVWAQSVNAAGGVNGRRVQVLVADDGTDPRRHRELTQQFVEEHDVIAFVGNPMALTGAETVAYIERVGVPVIGGVASGGNFFYDSPFYRPQGPHGLYQNQVAQQSQGAFAREHGLLRWGVLTCVETQACTDLANTFEEGAERQGAEAVYVGRGSIAQPDFTSECLEARRAGVNFFVLGMDANSGRRIAAACARQGFEPQYSFPPQTLTNEAAGVEEFQGALVPSTVAPWFRDDTTALREFQAALQAAGAAVHPTSLLGWTAAKMFEEALRNAQNPTRAGILAAVDAFDGFDAGGLMYPATFKAGEPAPREGCYWNVIIDGGDWRSPDGGRRHCIDD